MGSPTRSIRRSKTPQLFFEIPNAQRCFGHSCILMRIFAHGLSATLGIDLYARAPEQQAVEEKTTG